MSDLARIRDQIVRRLQLAGHKPLAERLREITSHAGQLGRAIEKHQVRDEAGQLLCTLMQLCQESGWDVADLTMATLDKLAVQHDHEAHRALEASIDSAIRRVAVYIGSFDPPGRSHRAAVLRLLENGFDEVIVRPVAVRYGGDGPEHLASMHRAALADLTFGGLPRVSIDFSELDRGPKGDPVHLEDRYPPATELAYAVGAELVAGGQSGSSVIQLHWERGPERWQRDHFLVLHAADKRPTPADLPPRHKLFELENHVPSAELRSRIFAGNPVDTWVTPEVGEYIRRQRLFVPTLPGQRSCLTFTEPRLLIEFDQRNEQARRTAERYAAYQSDSPNAVLVIGGDGTMLHAIRRHWRLRIPFVGLNAGHLGFLANERLPEKLEGLELVSYALPMLRVETVSHAGRVTHGLAFSDAWLERDTGQAAWLRLDVDGRTRVPKIVGDGMLIATAAGSSAYARALGSIPVPFNTPVLTLAGSNIFQPRFWKPMNLCDEALISLVNLDDTGKRPVRSFLDGQPLGVVHSMDVRRSAVAGVELAFTQEFDPSAKLLRSLFPPQEEIK